MAINSKVVGVILVITSCFYLQGAEAVFCKRCIYAKSIADCFQSLPCAPNEECFVDEILTPQGIVYDAGCRAKYLCQSNTTHVLAGRKKRSGEFLTCSKCCDKTDCNTNICGVGQAGLPPHNCYHCEDHTSYPSVTNPEQCTSTTQCSTTELCYAVKSVAGSQERYSFGCRSALICGLLMRRVFAQLDACAGSSCPTLRSSDVCSVCCGDGGCNHGDCQDIQMKYYRLHQQGRLDPNTLSIH